jgi:hypothetical protein
MFGFFGILTILKRYLKLSLNYLKKLLFLFDAVCLAFINFKYLLNNIIIHIYKYINKFIICFSMSLPKLNFHPTFIN